MPPVPPSLRAQRRSSHWRWRFAPLWPTAASLAAATVAALVGVVVAAAAPPLLARAGGSPTETGCQWLAPVDAPVVDQFRPPSNPYGPGNLGLEYGAAPGQAVKAVADGQVGFVGPVGGRRYVVVAHASGLRSTYGPLATIAVVQGQAVAAGDRLGSAAPGLHLTARVGSRYVDPTPLLAGQCGRARLVPG